MRETPVTRPDRGRCPPVTCACTYGGRGDPLLNVSFFGVRGSTPSPCDENRRYGGNTSCVALEAPGHDPDRPRPRHRSPVLGRDPRPVAPVRRLGAPHPHPLGPRAGPAVLHARAAAGRPLRRLRPAAARRGLARGGLQRARCARRSSRSPPRSSSATSASTTSWEADLELDGAKVKVRPVPHVGLTNGYRIEMGGAAVAYLSDHQMPLDGSHTVSDAVLELCDGVDLLIHDAQYTVEEFPAKATWGHCTADYAVHVAKEAGAAPPGAVPPRPHPRRRLRRRDPRPRPAGRRRAPGSPRSSPPRRASSSAFP